MSNTKQPPEELVQLIMEALKSHMKKVEIDGNFLEKCSRRFRKKKMNLICRNAISSVGSQLSCMNPNVLNDMDHIFVTSLKNKGARATNQGMTGRCWMFAGLNLFRHKVAKMFGMVDFQFSATYLFFYDKLERVNTYLNYFIDHEEVSPDDRLFSYYVNGFVEDGGWWNMFANLIDKYGVVPKSAMKETFQSCDSEDMNEILKTIANSAAFRLHSSKLSKKEKKRLKKKTMMEIYNTLVKFIGEPPSKFRWSFSTDENGVIVKGMDPLSFSRLAFGSRIFTMDYVVLTHLPTLKTNTMYEVQHSKNINEGREFRFFNVELNDFVRYCMKSISEGSPVWFACDVTKNFNPYYSTLNDKLEETEALFCEVDKSYDKKQTLLFGGAEANHAMVITGVNKHRGKPVEWQVENSWGYEDNETPGMDGFLTMSHSWFRKNVFQIVVERQFLSRTMQKNIIKQEENPVSIPPWSTVVPALKINLNTKTLHLMHKTQHIRKNMSSRR